MSFAWKFAPITRQKFRWLMTYYDIRAYYVMHLAAPNPELAQWMLNVDCSHAFVSGCFLKHVQTELVLQDSSRSAWDFALITQQNQSSMHYKISLTNDVLRNVSCCINHAMKIAACMQHNDPVNLQIRRLLQENWLQAFIDRSIRVADLNESGLVMYEHRPPDASALGWEASIMQTTSPYFFWKALRQVV